MAMKRKRNSMTSNWLEGNRVADKVDGKLCCPSFADLPSDITSKFLLRLPIKSVLISRCVCKGWNTLISDPHFTKLHFKTASIGVLIRTNDPKRRVSRTLHLLDYEPEKFDTCTYDVDDQFRWCADNFLKPECDSDIKLEPKFKLPLRDAKLVLTKREETKNGGGRKTTNYVACKPRDDKFAVVNSCNGLLCLCDPKDKDPLVICNPLTGEFIRLPETTRSEEMRKQIYAGFGFHFKTNEYKVVRMYKRFIKDLHNVREWTYDHMVVEMHTLGTSTWRNIECDTGFIWCVYMLTFPTCVNDALHWIFSVWNGSILRFNFESERFESFPPPPGVFKKYLSKNTQNISMGELKGFLYICDVSSFNRVRMWVMKNYGIGESWSKIFTFSIDHMDGDQRPYGLFWPVKLFKNGAAILMYHSSNCFIYYEPKKYGFKFFKVRGTQSKIEAIPHIPSLISLKDVVKGDNVEVLSVHSRCAKIKLREENEDLFLAEEDFEIASSYSFSSDDEYEEDSS